MRQSLGFGVFAGALSGVAGQFVMHALSYGDSERSSAFRFLLEPLPILVMAVFLLAGIGCLVAAARRRRTDGASPSWGACVGWAALTALVESVLVSIAFTGIDEHGYWLLALMVVGGGGFVISFVVICLLVLLLALLTRPKSPGA